MSVDPSSNTRHQTCRVWVRDIVEPFLVSSTDPGGMAQIPMAIDASRSQFIAFKTTSGRFVRIQLADVVAFELP